MKIFGRKYSLSIPPILCSVRCVMRYTVVSSQYQPNRQTDGQTHSKSMFTAPA